MNDELAFHSKVDWWLLILVLSAVAVCGWILAAYWARLLAHGWVFASLLTLPLAAGVLVPLWLVVSLRYFLSDEMLRVRCGPWQWRIAIPDITSVNPASDPLSSPALSLDRLRIEYGGDRAVTISPEPRDEFLRQLEFRRRQAA